MLDKIIFPYEIQKNNLSIYEQIKTNIKIQKKTNIGEPE